MSNYEDVMKNIETVPEWSFDPEDVNCRDMHQLRSDLTVLPQGPSFIIRTLIIGHDKSVDEYKILVLKEADGSYILPSRVLGQDDANVKGCVMRVCQDAIGRAPDAICTAMPWKHEGEGATLVFAYVIFIKDIHAFRPDFARQLWLLPLQVDWIVGTSEIDWATAPECHQAFNAFWAARRRNPGA